jgi:hypothetical protein
MAKEKVPTDVGDEKQIKKKKVKYNLVRENQLEEIRELLKTPYGRGFIWRIISHCNVFHSISRHDALAMAAASGGRDVGLWILKEVEQADVNGFMKLFREDQKREMDNG